MSPEGIWTADPLLFLTVPYRVPTASHLQLPRHGYSYGSSLRPVAWASPLVLQPALMQQPVSTSSSAQALRCLPQAKATNSFDSVAAVADSGSESDGNETFYTGAAGDGSAGASSQFVLLPSHQINRRQRRAFRREARRLLAAPSKGWVVGGLLRARDVRLLLLHAHYFDSTQDVTGWVGRRVTHSSIRNHLFEPRSYALCASPRLR
jgi:hypothetical protein